MSNTTSMKKFREYSQDQVLLMPPSLRDWVPAHHPVHSIDQVVNDLDLSAIYADYSEAKGQPPYNPRMMVKVWVYAYSRGIRSSRRLERALYDDIGFRFLSGNQQPDFWTLAAFRRRHHQALGGLLAQTVQVAARAGLVPGKHVAVDGTKVQANASKHSAMSYGRMKREIKRLQQEIDQYLTECEDTDDQEDEQLGDSAGWTLPEHLDTAQKRLRAIREAKAALEAEAQEKAQEEEAARTRDDAAKGTKRKRKAKSSTPPDRAQRNFTDPESRIMKSADKSFIQGYNAQVAVDTQSMIVVAGDLTNQAADSPHLLDMVGHVERIIGHRPRQLSADAGYYSEANRAFLEEQQIEAFIPPDKVKHRQWRTQRAPCGRIPQSATPKERMRRKLRTKVGRATYLKRQTTVEPTIGHLKEPMGIRRLLLRGLSKARSEWLFACAVYNLKKVIWARGTPQMAPT